MRPLCAGDVGGESVTLVSDDCAEHGFRACVLFEWVAGRSLRTCLTGRRAAALGQIVGPAERHAVGWSPSGAGDVLRAERVLYWRLPETLRVAGSRFGFGTLFADALARAQSAVDSLWRSPPHPPRLLHGVLTPANVIVSPPSGLVPIDFQDTVRGFEVQDLSITVAALRRWPARGSLMRSAAGTANAGPGRRSPRPCSSRSSLPGACTR